MKNNFNLIISGVGGQGVITLLSIVDEAAFIEGYDIKSSELHGLSQRGGSVETHIRFGKKVNSPLIQMGAANLIVGTEISEGLRSAAKAGSQTKILVDDYYLPFNDALKLDDAKASLNKINSGVIVVPASKICKEKLQNSIVGGIYLLGYAVSKGLLPIKKESFLRAIKTIVPPKYQELNIKAFQLAF